MISIHALLAESDLVLLATEIQFENFYPRSPCGERPHGRAAAGCGIHISIHALLAESDDAYLAALGKGVQISIHALLAESDGASEGADIGDKVFLSTLSLRRATVNTSLALSALGDFYPRSPCGERRKKMELNRTARNFYPRSPCGERRWLRCWQLAARDISIHALLAESDPTRGEHHANSQQFLSTLSLRRATIHQ